MKLVNKFELSCFASKLNFPDKVPLFSTFKNLLLKSQSVYQRIIYPRQRNQIIPLKYIRVSWKRISLDCKTVGFFFSQNQFSVA